MSARLEQAAKRLAQRVRQSSVDRGELLRAHVVAVNDTNRTLLCKANMSLVEVDWVTLDSVQTGNWVFIRKIQNRQTSRYILDSVYEHGSPGPDSPDWTEASRAARTPEMLSHRIAAYDLLDINPTGNVGLNPESCRVVPGATRKVELGSYYNRFDSLYGSELGTASLVPSGAISAIGGKIFVGLRTILASAVAATATAITVKDSDLADGDVIYLEDLGQFEFMRVDASGASGDAGGASGGYIWTFPVTRGYDGNDAKSWYRGSAVANTGQTGSSFIELYSSQGIKAAQVGPTIAMSVRTGSGATDWLEHAALGNLNGLYGYDEDTFGVAFGKYAANKTFITIDETNGFRVFNGTADVVAQWKANGDIIVGKEASGQSNVYISSGAVYLRNNTTNKIVLEADGGSYFAGIMTIGTNGEIRQGTGTLGVDFTGLRIWNATGIGRVSAYEDDDEYVWLNDDGLSLKGGTSVLYIDLDEASKVKWFRSGGQVIADVSAHTQSGAEIYINEMEIRARYLNDGGQPYYGQLTLVAESAAQSEAGANYGSRITLVSDLATQTGQQIGFGFGTPESGVFGVLWVKPTVVEFGVSPRLDNELWLTGESYDSEAPDINVLRLNGSDQLELNPDTTFIGNVGFYNTAPQAKPTITGSRGGNAGLASLLTQLANLGLITDSTSA